MTITNEQQDIETPTGPMRTYVFRPVAEGRFPGMVLYSEIFQMTGPIRRTAEALAGQGYVVAVPEVYHELEPAGTVLAYDTEGAERGNADKFAKEVSSYDSDAQAVLQFLKAHAHCTGKLGVMGVCLGGHLAFRAAMNSEVQAGACFYATDIHTHTLGLGQNDDTLKRMGEITGEMLMIWGRQDPHVPREGRQVIYNAMNDANLTMQWHEFNGAHAFLRDEGVRYDPSLTRLCYTLVLELFERRLRD
jgi:carboxymethylenebutenolidase